MQCKNEGCSNEIVESKGPNKRKYCDSCQKLMRKKRRQARKANAGEKTETPVTDEGTATVERIAKEGEEAAADDGADVEVVEE